MQEFIEIVSGLRVTGDGVAWLPDIRTIVVADVHLGYELAAQRRGGYLPPVAGGRAVGERLVTMARHRDADRIVIAGDLRHSTHDVDEFEREELAMLASVVRDAGVRLDVVLGNHDRGGAIVGAEEHHSLDLAGVLIVHTPPVAAAATATRTGWTICGHLHPRISVQDETGAAARYRCALAGPAFIVLPAFSDWAGGVDVQRLLRTLPRGRWRALPMVDGLIADLGISFPPRAA